jgi:hypothetical protein
MIVHVTGPNRRYVPEMRDNYDPSTSARFAKEVPVGTLTTTMTKFQLALLMYQTPVNNSSREYNCQTWIGDVLDVLVGRGFMTREAFDSATSAMAAVIVEAKDEPT